MDSHGNPVEETREASLNFADIVSTISDEPYKGSNFEEYEKENAVPDTQLYNLHAASLDKCFTLNESYVSEHDLMAQEDYERIITLVYTVEFPPGSEKAVSVSYRASGTMDIMFIRQL
ncbi:MAG TPA: hypothetical protein VEG39_21350 [Clostridia bacterium]|nr:hypothetical protein [Clostridia bacterium]